VPAGGVPLARQSLFSGAGVPDADNSRVSSVVFAAVEIEKYFKRRKGTA